jgi:hypothetical protein
MSSSDHSILEHLQRLRTHLWGENRINVVREARKCYSTVDLALFVLPQRRSYPNNILLIREEYKLAYDAIPRDTPDKTTEGYRPTFLVTGRPGTGTLG